MQKPKHWYFGGIERKEETKADGTRVYKTGLAFAVPVERRDSATLLPLIHKHIKEKSVIFSDEWKAYTRLQEGDFRHYTVCHKRVFVNVVVSEEGEEIRVNTNSIEGFWSQIKNRIKALYGTSEELQPSYFYEMVFRNNMRVTGRDLHSEFWRLVAAKYPI